MASQSVSSSQKVSDKKSKIPDFAQEFKNEWLYIRGINKKCGDYVKRMVFGGELFYSPFTNAMKKYMKNFLKGLECGKLKDISNFYIKYHNVRNIDCLEEKLDSYRDIYIDSYSYVFDQESYDLHIDSDYPGFKEFF